MTDTGVSIVPDMLHKVFDMYTQVGRSLDRAKGGLGIGLSLVKKNLVELQGGTVTGAGPTAWPCSSRSRGMSAGRPTPGRTPLTAAYEYRPDVVLLDIGLPGMNGYDVAREIRRDSSLGRPALVAVTGLGTEKDKWRAREAGFDDHLTDLAGPADWQAPVPAVPPPA
jgi:CheY-like chemotaxis protein